MRSENDLAERSPAASPARRLREAFDALIDVPFAERSAWLESNIADDAQRAELAKLVEADDARGYLDTPVMERAAKFAADDLVTATLLGTKIGAFRLVAEIGRGGMAAVFLAEREGNDVKQRVAVKLLRRGLYSELEQRLFLRERQLLASLDHPNIARLIDAGVSEGRIPYLVMEYVDGVPITDYADAAQLDIRARLRLVIDVCHAVEAAHRLLIVHRDIKPSNILVSRDGQVKLLDFGIAKLVEDDARLATATRGIFTPEYAAPEQLGGGSITTATDVFGLGVLLYELLSGHRPRGTPIRKPSSIVADVPLSSAPIARGSAMRFKRQLRGDLDNVVLKALAEEPNRRYASASALADDLERYLAGHPVAAHPASTWYRTTKFVRRHRGGVVVAAAAIIAVAASMGLVIWQARVAHAEAKRASAVRDFVESIFAPLSNGTPENKQPRISELLASATDRMDKADLDAAARVDLLQMFARLNEKIAEPIKAQALADQAYDVAQRELGPNDANTLDALVSRGLIALHRDDFDTAAPLLEEAERRSRQVGGVGSSLIRLYDGLAVLADAKGDDPRKAVDYARAALAQRLATRGDDKASLGTGYNNLGYGLESLGDFAGAADAYRAAHDLAAATSGIDSAETAVTLSNLGAAEMLAGHLRSGRGDLLRAKALLANVGGKQRSIQVANAQQICTAQMAINPLHAEEACAADLRMTADEDGDTSGDYGLALRRQSLLALERGDIDASRKFLAQAAARIDATSNAVWQGRVDITQAELQLLGGQSKDAAHLLRRGVQRIGGSYPPHLRNYGLALLALACEGVVSDDCPADAFTVAAHEIDTAAYRGSAVLLPAQTVLARIDLQTGRSGAAVARLEFATTQAMGEMDADAPRLLEAQGWLARAHAANHQCAVAAQEFATIKQIAATEGLTLHPFLVSVAGAAPSCAR
ncbi:MAG TPA: serine/threonine-protein kinase [Rudaea sp.]|nr:serine/threonine-protein kinase [Rudaea sp.]